MGVHAFLESFQGPFQLHRHGKEAPPLVIGAYGRHHSVKGLILTVEHNRLPISVRPLPIALPLKLAVLSTLQNDCADPATLTVDMRDVRWTSAIKGCSENAHAIG